MAVIVWPSNLPQIPLQDSYSESLDAQIYDFQPDKGDEITRPAGTVRMDLAEIKLPPMTLEQTITFKEFVFHTLSQGTLPFTFNHPTEGHAIRCRMIGGTTPYQIRALSGTYFDVSFAARLTHL